MRMLTTQQKVLASLALTTLTVAGLSLTLGCAELPQDINRVQPPYVDKALFDGSWYYKKTVVDTAPGNQWVTQGDGDWAVIERIRWRIEEDMLWGYRDWEYVPGSETQGYEGSDYYGSPVVAYAIKEHFDIRRSYNAQTGEETNVTEKNTERNWNERKYMVVDWAQNLAPTYGLINWTFGIPISDVTSSAYYVQEHELDNPDRARIGEDYIDVVGKYQVWPDFLGCWYQYYEAVDCGPGEIHVRQSFLKVDPANDYQTMPFPDAVDQVDDDGNYVRDANGKIKRIPIFERFGDYRLDRLTYNQDYGRTDSGVERRVNRFDIWQKSLNDDGTPIPYHLREPKPIVYYLNVEFPDDENMAPELREQYSAKKAAFDMGEAWNEPFREVVAMLRVMSREGVETVSRSQIEAELASGDVPEKMFEVRDNSCNLNTVKSYVADHPDLVQDLDLYLGQNAIASLSKADLPSACSILEAKTQGLEDAFTWQRHGDLRYNMLVWVAKHMEAGWLGLGPMYMDPISGRTVSSTAHVAGALMDTAVTSVMDYIDALNGLTTEQDVVTGQDVQNYMAQARQALHDEVKAGLDQRTVDEMNRRFRQLGDDSHALLKEISPSLAKTRLAQAKGTTVEQMVIGHDDWTSAEALSDPQAAQALDAHELVDLASPVRPYRLEMFQRRRAQELDKAKHTRDFSPAFYDVALLSTALELRDRPRPERWAMLRYAYFKAVITHEVGHNIGMRHNFAASMDPLNYVKGFWDIQVLPSDLSAARSQLADQGDNRVDKIDRCMAEALVHPDKGITTQDCLGANEMKYASIMDYTHYNPVGDFSGLGMYDKAFVYFIYGGILEAFDDGAVDTDVLCADGLCERYGRNEAMRQWIWQNDYKKIPHLFGDDVNNIYKRHYQRYHWGMTTTKQAEPERLVPYKACFDEFAYNLPECRMMDYGANQTEVMETEINRYKEYYYYTHYNRGRTNWGWWQNPVYSDTRILNRARQTYQYMYYFRAQDPEFFNKDVGQDYLQASIMGLNLYGEVLATPPNGRFLELDADGGMLVSSRRDGYWVVEPSNEWLGGTTSNLSNQGGSGVLVESGYFGDCDRAATTENRLIPLGAGRPFFFGYSSDYEDWLFRYVGSYFTKDAALRLLADPSSSFLPYMSGHGVASYDPKTYSVNYFRLFRPEVLKAYYGVISGDVSTYASVFRRHGESWQYEPRKLFDLDGNMPDYTPSEDTKLVWPSMAYNIPYSALLYGNALMSNLVDGEQDFAKLTKIAVKGQEDDIGDFDRIPMYDREGVKQKAEFVHPLTGVTFRALRQGEYPIGYMMVEEANRRLARWRAFQHCVDFPDDDTGLCECTYQSQAQANGSYTCPEREVIGCIDQDREYRAERAMELVERQVELINNVRLFHSVFEFNL